MARTGTPQSLGRFEIISQIGEGNFATVFEAYDPHLDRRVALKVPRRKELDPVEAELFLREARTAAQIQHPNVVSIHEVDRADDQIYIVSDLIEGESLAAKLEQSELSIAETVRIVRTLATALQHVHDVGVVHRDIKPSNILMNEEGKPHLGDFGLARRRQGDITLTEDGQLIGTPAYMSPEQARGDAKSIDERSDIYGLGVVLYRLLTGCVPFDGAPHSILSQIICDEPRSPRRIKRYIPRDLATICLKSLEKMPDRRYFTASELVADLDRYSHGQRVLAQPTGIVTKSIRWAARHPLVSALVVMVICIVASTTSIKIARENELRAQIDKRNAQVRTAVFWQGMKFVAFNFGVWLERMNYLLERIEQMALTINDSKKESLLKTDPARAFGSNGIQRGHTAFESLR